VISPFQASHISNPVQNSEFVETEEQPVLPLVEGKASEYYLELQKQASETME
jgi:hypothetical protein